MRRSSETAYFERQIREAREKLELLELIPDRDDFAHGTAVKVVVDTRYGTRRTLTYLLLKIIDNEDGTEHRWYFTGRLAQAGGSQRGPNMRGYVEWSELVRWLINDVEIRSWDLLAVSVDSKE